MISKGTIEFIGESGQDFRVEKKEYIVVDHGANASVVLQLIQSKWNRNKVPSELYSITGGAKLEGMSRDHQAAFVHGIASAVGSKTSWVITGGSDAGIMQLAGKALYDAALDSPCIGIAALGKLFNTREEIGTVDRGGPIQYKLSEEPASGQDKARLNPDHTHFIFVRPPDGQEESKWGDDNKFREALEGEIAKTAVTVQVVASGGPETMKTVSSAAHAKIPIVLCKGSGRAADILCRLSAHAEHLSELDDSCPLGWCPDGAKHTAKLLDDNQGVDLDRRSSLNVFDAMSIDVWQTLEPLTACIPGKILQWMAMRSNPPNIDDFDEYCGNQWGACVTTSYSYEDWLGKHVRSRPCAARSGNGQAASGHRRLTNSDVENLWCWCVHIHLLHMGAILRLKRRGDEATDLQRHTLRRNSITSPIMSRAASTPRASTGHSSRIRITPDMQNGTLKDRDTVREALVAIAFGSPMRRRSDDQLKPKFEKAWPLLMRGMQAVRLGTFVTVDLSLVSSSLVRSMSLHGPAPSPSDGHGGSDLQELCRVILQDGAATGATSDIPTHRSASSMQPCEAHSVPATVELLLQCKQPWTLQEAMARAALIGKAMNPSRSCEGGLGTPGDALSHSRSGLSRASRSSPFEMAVRWNCLQTIRAWLRGALQTKSPQSDALNVIQLGLIDATLRDAGAVVACILQECSKTRGVLDKVDNRCLQQLLSPNDASQGDSSTRERSDTPGKYDWQQIDSQGKWEDFLPHINKSHFSGLESTAVSMNSPEEAKKSVRLLWALVNRKFSVARVFWRYCSEPLRMALYAAQVLRKLAGTDDAARTMLLSEADWYERLGIQVLELGGSSRDFNGWNITDQKNVSLWLRSTAPRSQVICDAILQQYSVSKHIEHGRCCWHLGWSCCRNIPSCCQCCYCCRDGLLQVSRLHQGSNLIRLAQRSESMEFMGHPVVQRRLRSLWRHNAWENPQGGLTAVWGCCRVWGCCANCDGAAICSWLYAPRTRCWLHSFVRVALTILHAVVILRHYDEPRAQLYLPIVFFGWKFLQLLEDILVATRLGTHDISVWDVLGTVDYAAMLVSLGLFVAAVSGDDGDMHDWSMDVLSVSFIVACIRLLDILAVIEFFGPMVITINRILFLDITLFVVLLVVFVGGFAVAITAIFVVRNPDAGYGEDVSGLEDLLWSLFGDWTLPLTNADRAEQGGDFYLGLGKALLGLHMLLSTIVIVNLLVALMTSSYENTHRDAQLRFNFSMALHVRKHRLLSALPAPLNLVGWIVGRTCWKCCCSSDNGEAADGGPSVSWNQSSLETVEQLPVLQALGPDDVTKVRFTRYRAQRRLVSKLEAEERRTEGQ